jgi:hypothetical protein
MAFQFAYALDGEASSIIKDFPLDTTANYGTGGMLKGDLVILNAGLLRKATATTTSGTSLGVTEGKEFTGISQGGDYAATNSSFTAKVTDTTNFPNGVGKVRIDKSSVIFRVPVKSGQTLSNANRGVSYGIFVDANNDQQLDTTNTTATLCKVIDFAPDGKTAFVQLT